MSADQHTAWCARDHRCALGEHRAEPTTFRISGAGCVVLTRVRAVNGAEHAEIRLRVTLPAGEAAARQRLTALLTHLRAMLGPPRIGRRAA